MAAGFTKIPSLPEARPIPAESPSTRAPARSGTPPGRGRSAASAARAARSAKKIKGTRGRTHRGYGRPVAPARTLEAVFGIALPSIDSQEVAMRRRKLQTYRSLLENQLTA